MVSSRRFELLLLLVTVYVCVSNVYAIYHHTAKISDSLRLDCCCGKGVNNFWKFEGVFIYFNKEQVDGLFGNDLSVLANYSLLIHSISLDHEGTYKCGQNSTTLYEHPVTVEVPPQLSTVVNDMIGTSEVFIEAKRVVVATCYAVQAKPAVNLTWMLNNRIIDSSKVNFTMYPNTNNSKTFDSKAEYINPPFNWEGNISCISSDQTVIKGQRMDIQYFKYALPKVFLTINDQNSGSGVYAVPGHREMVATCKVYGSYPMAKVTWQINNVSVDLEDSDVNIYVTTPQQNGTYDSILTIGYNPSDRNGSITCISKLEKVGITQIYSVTFYITVPPTVLISINGHGSKDLVRIVPNHEVIVHCDVRGSDSEFHLTWMINDKRITSSDKAFDLTTTKEGEGMAHGYRATLRFHPKMKRGNLTCTVSGPTIGEVYDHATFQIEETNSANKEFWKNMYLYLAISIAVLCCFSGAAAMLCKKCVSSKHSSLEAQNQFHLYERSVATPDSQVMLDQGKLQDQCTQHVAIPPPELPSTANSCDIYSSQLDNEQDYYSMLTPNATYRRMFNESDMCLVFNMKAGDLYNRWMGTISESDERKTCVVISSAAEATLLRKQIQWDVFVKRVLEIPDNDNLVKVQGICVGATQLFLIHEHLTCHTLESRLNCIQDVDKNAPFPMDTSEVMRHTLGILEGIELIHSYGLLHPALLTKKILLSQQGICKLYDFCLSDDAPRVITLKKSKETPSASIFAPECILRNEYFQASDVWSVAIVIWKLFSGGGLPTFIQKGNEDNLCNLWPERYRQLRNNYLFECWQNDFRLRPTIRQLRLSFLETKPLDIHSCVNSRESVIHFD